MWAHVIGATMNSLRARIVQWALLVPAVLTGSQLVLGEPNDSGLLDRSLEDITGREVSTVSKIPQRAADALASVTVIQGDDIGKFGYRTIGEVLQSVSGMYLSDDRSYGYIGVRGLNVPGDFNGRILLLIDGHRLNDPNYDYIPMLDDFPVDIQSIDRIEVIKGTSASVWGGNAIFATINVVTKTGRVVDGKHISAEYGTFSRRKLYADIGGITEAGLEYAFSAGTVHSNGQPSVYIPQFDGEGGFSGQFNKRDGMAAQRLTARVSYQKVNLLLNVGSRVKSIPGASYGTVLDAQNRTTDDIVNGEINTLQEISPHHSVLIRAYNDRNKYHQNAFVALDSGVAHNWDSAVTGLIGSECRLIGDWAGRGRYIVGLEAQTAYRLSFANANLDPYDLQYKESGRYRLHSAYVESMLVLKPGLQVTLGGRVDDYSLFARETNPRGGVTYALNSTTTLKALFGRAFRIPNNYERNIPPPPNSVGRYRLTPEHGFGGEGVLLIQPARDQSVQLSIFRYRLNNVVTQTTPEDLYGGFVNAGQIVTRGVDLAWRGRRDGGITWYMGATYADATGSDSQQLGNSPRWLSASGVSLPLSERSPWHISPSLRIVSPLKAQGSFVPWREIVDLTVGTSDLGGMVSAAFSVYNLFGADNPTVVGNQFSFPTMPSEGRTFRLQVGYSF